MKRRLRQIRGERGFALVLALATTVVLSISVTSAIIYTTSNTRTSDQSKRRVSAHDLAEAGINNALGILTKGDGFNVHTLHPQPPNQPSDCASPAPLADGTVLGNTCSPFTETYDGGTVTYSGWLDPVTQYWTITSTGSVRNAESGLDVRQTVVAKAHVHAAPSQENLVTAWNYVFLRDTTPGICNLTLQNSATVSISLYVSGNLCFENTSAVAETDNPSDGVPEDVNLEVLGRLVWKNGSSKGIGDTAITAPTNGAVTTAKIAGGCATSLTEAAHTCSPSTDYFYVQSGGYEETAPPIVTPALTDTDFTNYYNNAFIRPGDPCDNPGTNGSNRLANATFDNDTIALNGTGGNGSAATFDLTPINSYTCRATDAGGNVIGELDWDNVAKILTIRGTIYIDGSLTITQAGSYRGVNAEGLHPSGDTSGADGIGGQAVIYASGGFTMSNNIQMCGWNTRTDSTAKVGPSCDFNLWTPNTSMLMLVLHKSGAGAVSFSQSAMFQGGIYSLGDVSTGNSVEIHGPMLVNSLTISNSVKLRPIPYITDLPIGAPGNPNTRAVVDGAIYQGG